jgi:hypothetical protein
MQNLSLIDRDHKPQPSVNALLSIHKTKMKTAGPVLQPSQAPKPILQICREFHSSDAVKNELGSENQPPVLSELQQQMKRNEAMQASFSELSNYIYSMPNSGVIKKQDIYKFVRRPESHMTAIVQTPALLNPKSLLGKINTSLYDVDTFDARKENLVLSESDGKTEDASPNNGNQSPYSHHGQNHNPHLKILPVRANQLSRKSYTEDYDCGHRLAKSPLQNSHLNIGNQKARSSFSEYLKAPMPYSHSHSMSPSRDLELMTTTGNSSFIESTNVNPTKSKIRADAFIGQDSCPKRKGNLQSKCCGLF